MTGLGSLLCGDVECEGMAGRALKMLRKSIDDFSEKSINYFKQASSRDAVTFGPFCTRVVLENGCAALLGRLDAFRLSYLSEFQVQPEYEVGKRAKSSFSWTGDVIPDSDGGDMWNMNNDSQKISRALFSRYADHIFWKPAIIKMLDFIAGKSEENKFSDIVIIDPESFIGIMKGKGGRNYSALSKGVHWEFFSNDLVFDEATMRNLIMESLLMIAQLGLISHFMPTAYSSLLPDAALDAYNHFRGELA